MPRRSIVLRQLAAVALLFACCACIGDCDSNNPPPRAECDAADPSTAVVVDALEIVNPRGTVGLQGSGMLLFDVRLTGATPPGCAGVDWVVRDAASGDAYEGGHVNLEMEGAAAGGATSREPHRMLWQFPDRVELEVTAYGHTERVEVCQYGCEDPDAGL